MAGLPAAWAEALITPRLFFVDGYFSSPNAIITEIGFNARRLRVPWAPRVPCPSQGCNQHTNISSRPSVFNCIRSIIWCYPIYTAKELPYQRSSPGTSSRKIPPVLKCQQVALASPSFVMFSTYLRPHHGRAFVVLNMKSSSASRDLLGLGHEPCYNP